MRNSSQNAGCMRRLPASHSCHPRKVQWMSAAAAVCESPADSRAARTSSGVGFRAGLPARLRLGWFVISEPAGFGLPGASDAIDEAGIGLRLLDGRRARKGFALITEFAVDSPDERSVFAVELDVGVHRGIPVFMIDGDAERKKCFHFLAPAPVPEARCKRSVYDSNYTRIACNRKYFFTGEMTCR